MIRRPATIISLGDYEVQSRLRQIFLRTLPADFNLLRLDDPNHSYGGDTLHDSSGGTSACSDSGSEFDFDSMLDSIPASSCIGNSPHIQGNTARMASTAQPAAAMTASLHRTIDTKEASGTTTSPQIFTILPRHRASQRHGQSSSDPVLSVTRQLLEKRSLSPRDQRRKGLSCPSGWLSVNFKSLANNLAENCPQSSTDPKTNTKDTSRLSMSQTCPSSPDAFPELTFSTVPLRALSLAPTESDDSVLASAKDSSTTVMDFNWEFGAIQPDSIFEDSCTNTPRV